MTKNYNADALAKELANLPHIDRTLLKERWQELYGAPPPVSFSQRFLLRGIAYRLQEKTFGGLKLSTKKLFKKSEPERNVSVPAITVKSGTKLLREWHGTIHEVIVQDAGVLFNGKSYRSLTEVAQLITGAHWSGPRFFGLKKARAA